MLAASMLLDVHRKIRSSLHAKRTKLAHPHPRARDDAITRPFPALKNSNLSLLC